MLNDSDMLVYRYYTQLYQEIVSYKLIAQHKKTDPPCCTQGEILYDSQNHIISAITLNKQDIFFDLGSGLGKVVVHFFLQTPVKQACGIELLPELYEQSMKLAQKIQQDLPDFYHPDRKLRFILGDFLNIPFSEATVILLSSVCFGHTLMTRIGMLIDRHPHIHTALSLRPIPYLRRLALDKTIAVECTWDSALCYVYKKKI